ncbi:MAG: FMN-binding protein [Firmicutes bacterium]|nr:FMN-binding protein [Bacillota bacterium]
MQFFWDIIFARLTLLIIISLSALYIIRKIVLKYRAKTSGFIITLSRLLRQYHKPLGILAILLGLVHGILSSNDILTFNLGTLSWVLLILLGVSWFYKAKFQKNWLYYHRILASLLILTVVLHIGEVGGFSSGLLNISPNKKLIQNNPNSDTSRKNNAPDTTNITNAKYKDGTYTGTANGYRPGLIVQVAITNGAISNIDIVSHNERYPNYTLAIKQVPADIIKHQSTNVDGVSSATKTSNGIKNAVNAALAQAINQ